jgi:hypothetical protein
MVNNDNTLNDYQLQHNNNSNNNLHHTSTNINGIISHEITDKNSTSNTFFPPLN